MPFTQYIQNDIRGTVTYRLITLETEIANIQYLLAFPELTEAQKQRLQSLLLATEAELREINARLRAS
jgi:hypothetical protein